jgi:glutaredoxin 3
MIFTIYTQPGCTYCEQAKALIKSKGHTYLELILNIGQKQEEDKIYVPVVKLKERVPNAKSVPQIFEGSTYIGDFDKLQHFLRYD